MKQPKIRFKGFSGEWEKSTIGNISTSFSGGTPSVGVANYYGGSIPFIRSGEIAEDKTQLFLTEEGLNSSSARMVEKGTLLYALYGATSGEVGVSKIDGAINQAILAIIPKKGYSTTYLSHYLRGKKDIIVGALLQGGQGNLSGALVKEVEVNLPRTFEEQCAIANYLDHLDSLIQSTTKKIDSLKQVKAASLQSMFPQEGETTPRIRFKGFEGEWEKVAINEVSIINPKSDIPSVFEYVDLESVVGTELKAHRTETVQTAPSRAQRLAMKGDIFYQTVRPYQKNNYYFNLDKDNYVFSSGYAQIRCAKFGAFLFALMQQESFLKSVMNNCTGTSFPAINANVLGTIEIMFTRNDAEQQQIASYFTALDTQITLQTQRLEKLKQIKSACLDNMFV